MAAVLVPLALVAITAVKIFPGLGPHSLYLDDEWVAIVLRDSGVRERIGLNLPMPLGFALLASLPTRAWPGSPLALQLVPALAYVASVALFPVLIYRLSRNPWVAALGAAIFAAGPLPIRYAVRIKHYTLDQLVTVGLLLAMIGLFRARSTRRFLGWTLLLAVAVLLSFSSVFLASVALATACAALWITPAGEGVARLRKTTAAIGATFIVAVGAFFFFYVSRASRPVMVQYWSRYFPVLDGWAGIWYFLSRRVSAFLLFPLPDWAWVFALAGPLGFVWLWRRGHREYCVALGAFYGAMLASAAARVYPMGTGRTDIFATPITALLVCLGIAELLSRIRSAGLRRVLTSAVTVYFAISLIASPERTYPPTNDSEAVQVALAHLRSEDALVLSPYAAFAFAYYGGTATTLVPVDYYANGFDVVVQRPYTMTTAFGRWDLRTVEAVEAEHRRLASFVQQAPDRIIYLATQTDPSGRNAAVRTILGGGYRLSASSRFGGWAEAFQFDRRGTLPPR